MQAEWRAYELELTGYMDKMNAWAARQAKRDKRSAVELLDASEAARSYDALPGEAPQTTKAQLRAQLGATVAAGRFGAARAGPRLAPTGTEAGE